MFPHFRSSRRAGDSVPAGGPITNRKRRKARRRQRYFRPLGEQLEARWLLSTFQVTTELDVVNAGDGLTSLREAVTLANDQAGHDTITFASSLANKPVVLLSGQMIITDTVTIQGLGSAQTTIDGLSATRLFEITNTAGDVRFDGLTLTGGKTTANNERGGAIRSSSFGLLTIQDSTIDRNSTEGPNSRGGAIRAEGSVAVTNSTISGNKTLGISAYGGGISALGSVTVTHSTISGNSTASSTASGGAIFAGQIATISDSTISGNSTAGSSSFGGGIRSQVVKVTNSTISGNSTGGSDSRGGGISVSDSVTITNSTVSGNFTTNVTASGGGIDANFSVTAINSTITANKVSGQNADGGGIFSANGPMTIRNSIVAENFDIQNGSHPDLRPSGTLTVRFSLIGANTGTGLTPATIAASPDFNLIGGTGAAKLNPMLGPLTENGGLTRTHRPLAGSPVINAGNNSLAVDPVAQAALTTDQRGTGFGRIVGGTVDMGAVELGPVPFPLVVTTANDERDATPNAADLSLREAVALANGGLGADTITFAAALTGQPILLTLGQMTISDAVTIQGLGAAQTSVVGSAVPSQFSRLFNLSTGAGDVTFDGFTLTGGRAVDVTGGGAISSISLGHLTIRNSVISGNTASADGGGVYALNNVSLINSTVSGNGGGGIRSRASVAVTNSTISENTTRYWGGGIHAGSPHTPGDAIVTNSTIFGNSTTGDNGNGGGIYASSRVSITNSTISGNSTTGEESKGGGIFANSTLEVTNSTISGNSTTGSFARGGGIHARDVMITNSTISGNSTSSNSSPGGGIFVNGPSAVISNSTISGNSTAGTESNGGGISATVNQMTLTNTTVTGNSTSSALSPGGGVFVNASLTVSNSTISGNSTSGDESDGGGLSATIYQMTLTNTTVTGNSVADADGGGISTHGPLTIRNSIVAGNQDTQDGSHPDLRRLGTLTVEYSLIGDNNGTGLAAGMPAANGNLIGTHAAPIDPMLGPLQNNGGSTQTHMLLACSPALDSGDPMFAGPPNNDQRGASFVRVADGPDAGTAARIDMGAYEFQAFVPTALVVDTNVDENDGNFSAGDLSLREAVALAKCNLGVSTITFAPAMAGQTILLTLGQITISDPLTIQGLGADKTTVDGQNNSRLFDITSAAGDVTFDGVSLTGGKTTAGAERGGAIRSNSGGQLTIQNSKVSGNSTIGDHSRGGGIFASGSLSITNSTISGNSTAGSQAYGGGIFANSTLAVTNSTISGNSTTGGIAGGGGIFAGSVTITNSTISGNSTLLPLSPGGGVFVNGSLTVSNSTISGNSTAGTGSNGGGLSATSPVADLMTLTNTTVTGNSVAGMNADGGGVFRTSGPVTIRNSIVAGNSDLQNASHPDVRPGGTLTVEYSLIGTNAGTALVEANPGPDASGNKIGGPASGVLIARLGPLSNNGGTTQTHALCTAASVPHATCAAASPALNAGAPNFAPPPTTDQRGSPFARVALGRIDMGAFENQGTFTVNSTADTGDANIGNGICDVGGGVCTLRAALQEANALAGMQLIKFNIPGSGPHTITPTSALPTISDEVIIDGTTQSGFVSAPLIELNGTSAGASVNGLTITAGGSTIKGLTINRFSRAGIDLRTAGNNVVTGNYIGTNNTGAADQGNAQSGVLINGSPNNTIGGTTAAARNVISGNDTYGVQIVGASATGNLVQGNYIGTNAAGTGAVGNTLSGVVLSNAASNTIGGTVAGARNVISGNKQRGVYVAGAGSTGNLVQGNYIGTNAAGTAGLGNLLSGVQIDGNATANTIGGTVAAARNILSSNGQYGVFLSGAGATSNLVQGNYIGTNAAGTAALGNTLSGVLLSGAVGNTIGGTTAGARNVISGNRVYGVQILNVAAPGNLVQGNYIGTNAAGTSAVANTLSGVVASNAASNTIGGTVAGARNVISGNKQRGVYLSGAGTTGNLVQGNYIGTNAAGTAGLGNLLSGVQIDGSATANTIGGTVAAARNILSSNVQYGVFLSGAGVTGNLVQGNYIGTNAAGTAALGNTITGVLFSGVVGNTIGGTTAGARNVISGNRVYGVQILNVAAPGNLLQGNYIGTNAAGTGAVANTLNGVVLSNAASNSIGGSVAGAGNLISGNLQRGVYLAGPSTKNNLVQGNSIGTNAAGTAALGNALSGVQVDGSANRNTIGGTIAAARNLISGNQLHGVLMTGVGVTGNLVQGNYIGTNAAGTGDLGNTFDGVVIDNAPNNTIGGTAVGTRNVISGNDRYGIQILSTSATGNLIRGNFIGTDVTGTADVGNRVAGIKISGASNNLIGGTGSAMRNVISGNDGVGVLIAGTNSTGNLVQGNFIGTDNSGTVALGNSLDGVNLNGGLGNTIGGTAAGAGNKIAFNGRDGVRAAGASVRGAILRNSMFSNVGLGIDLGGNAVTANDANDPDAGPNNLQNFPVMSSAILSGANLQITYSVPSIAPNSAFPLAVEFFLADPAGQEGRIFLGSHSYAQGTTPTATVPKGGAVAGQKIVATATDANGNTSEFSTNATVANPLLAAGGPVENSAATPLTRGDLQPIIGAALTRFAAAGLAQAQLAALSQVQFLIADLPGATLGSAGGRVVTLDATAAGHGWFIDPTPLDDSEFTSGPQPSTLDSQLRMDLLTAVMHELGHTLGLDDLHDDGAENDLMYEALAVGVRGTMLPPAVDAAEQ